MRPGSILKPWPAALPLAAAVLFGGRMLFAAANFPVGTYVVTGDAKDWRNRVIGATEESGAATTDAGIRMQAVATNGTILAECKVAMPANVTDGRNFSLSVPLSTARTDSTAQVGDELRLVLVDGAITNVASQTFAITAANASTNVSIQLVATRTFVSDEHGTVAVSESYLDEIAGDLEDYGGTYDPWADYDGDGRSNYSEYLSGTNPFDESDFLSIRDFRLTRSRVAVTFEYNGGYLYAVEATESLSDPKWAAEKLATDAGAEPAQSAVVFGDADGDGIGLATLYMVPVEGAASRFYKLGVK